MSYNQNLVHWKTTHNMRECNSWNTFLCRNASPFALFGQSGMRLFNIGLNKFKDISAWKLKENKMWNLVGAKAVYNNQ